MAINFVHAPPCGNAVSLTVMPVAWATAWRLLRRLDADFVGADDPAAVRVAEGDAGREMFSVFDYQGLTNGQPAWYQHYVRFADDAWEPSGNPVSVTPAYLAEPLFASPDLAGLVRERLALGLAEEVKAGRLRHETGAIPVLTAQPLIDQVKLPVVTVILTERRAEVRGIGEGLLPDQFDGEFWSVYEGWLDRSTLQIAVWSLNHSDRLRLRDAVQRILMLNLPVLDAAGYLTPDLSEADSADFENYGAPTFQSIFTLSCLHAALVRDQAIPLRITEVPVNAEATYY
jgi:hypothetical protein